MKTNVGFAGYVKCTDRQSGVTKGYFVYFVQKIPVEYGEGTRIVAPRDRSSLWLSPEQFGKLNLKVGSTYECYSSNGYIEWDSLKEVTR